MIDESQKRRFYAVRHEDDIPDTAKGFLIPPVKKGYRSRKNTNYLSLSLLPLMVLFLLFGVGMVGVQVLASMNMAAVTQISIVNPYTAEVKPFSYGVQLSLTESNFFTETREAFIEKELTFLEADLSNMQLRYFEEGVLVESVTIESKAKMGSRCQVPAGLYKVESKKENYFSGIGQVYQPWSIGFQSNFYIHGWSNYGNQSLVPEEFDGDCIRLNNDDAKNIFKKVKINTPVLVHEVDFGVQPFLYEAKIPEMEALHYLVADIESDTVLASSDINVVLPIASITKLMTALVAAEHINLDKNVSVTNSTFVQSLVPRLEGMNQVSMYSLLQLLLIESSNEAAEVIALQLGREKFIELMNEKAKTIGMNDTRFVDPSGLGAENVSSPSDLLRLMKYIYSNRKFILELTANQKLPTSYVSGEFGELANFNKIEGLGNFIGGKVGETNAAKQTSVSLHRLSVKNTERIIAVILLGSENRNQDVTELLRYAEERFGS